MRTKRAAASHLPTPLGAILAATGLLLPAPTSAQEPETFRPGFAWKPGLEFQASETRAGVLREGAASDSGLVSRATYRIVVAEHPDGLLISHRDVRVERPGEFPDEMPPTDRINVVVADNLKYWMRLPDLVVSEKGEFLRVDDPDEQLLLEDTVAEHELGWVSEERLTWLTHLAGTHQLGLVSDVWAPSRRLRAYLGTSKLADLLDAIVISSDVGAVKPSGRVFGLALRQMRTDPRSVVFIGDNSNFHVFFRIEIVPMLHSIHCSLCHSSF